MEVRCLRGCSTQPEEFSPAFEVEDYLLLLNFSFDP
jgi:hypothetical protein